MSDDMLPSQVRARVLEEHEVLEGLLSDLERQARTETLDRAALRAAFVRMRPVLADHRAFEDEHLSQALMEADAWGDVRTASLADHHDVQARHVADAWKVIEDPASAEDAVRTAAVETVARLRAEMRQEEDELLDPKVLRDDVVVIGGFGG